MRRYLIPASACVALLTAFSITLYVAQQRQRNFVVMHQQVQDFADAYQTPMDLSQRSDGRYCGSISGLHQMPTNAKLITVLLPALPHHHHRQ